MNVLINQSILDSVRALPHEPGVYLFKNLNRQIVYIGKAKDLRNRVSQYVQRVGVDVKASSILAVATTVDYLQTPTELEALLLEAQLIQNHQPRFNVLLKDGQPFLWLTITIAKTDNELPRLELVRNKKKKGFYLGPFLEKSHARMVYEYLLRTFQLKLCNKKIVNGCLHYHLGSCAGSCRPNFDIQGYKDRLAWVQLALQKGRKPFFDFVHSEIVTANKMLNFERSRELHKLLESFDRVFDALDGKKTNAAVYVKKDLWVLSADKQELFFYEERDTVLKKRQNFLLYNNERDDFLLESIKEYFLSVYRQRRPAHVILTNIDFGEDKNLFQQFLQSLHNLDLEPTIHTEVDEHYGQLIKMALLEMENAIKKRQSLGMLLKKLLHLPHEPISIDCFDISHKQGTFMVGSCIRFINGKPEPSKFRRFKIKTVEGQNDYASLQEVVARRYREGNDFPDLILIDGGKGQLNAVVNLFPSVEFASLAKREETIFSHRIPDGKILDLQSYAGQTLVALRDYTHHFAISYHRLLASQIYED